MLKWEFIKIDEENFVARFFYSEGNTIRTNESHEKFAQNWTEILLLLETEIAPNHVFIELYPTLAGNIIGPLEDELNMLQSKFESCKHFNIKSISKNLMQLTFLLSDKNDLPELIYKFLEEHQLILYFCNEKFNYENFYKHLALGNCESRKDQFRSLAKEGCIQIIEFHDIGIEMEIASNISYQSCFNILNKRLK